MSDAAAIEALYNKYKEEDEEAIGVDGACACVRLFRAKKTEIKHVCIVISCCRFEWAWTKLVIGWPALNQYEPT